MVEELIEIKYEEEKRFRDDEDEKSPYNNEEGDDGELFEVYLIYCYGPFSKSSVTH